MNSKSWFKGVFSKTLTGMAALFMLSVGTAAYAAGPDMNVQAQQTKKVTGTVVDATGEPIIGATVMQKGTNNATVTDIDGNYTLDVPAGATLVISYIGMTTQEVPANGGVTTLQDDSKALDEVVVTALGIKRQARSLGYSTTQVGGEDFQLARDPNIGNALSGKIAGVSVSGNATGSTGSSRVIIRGNASLTGNNMPLYVVDGVPFDNTNQGSAGTWGGMDMGDGLANINADDIESIQVLKGAAASALYGYRGGNGAILITTKSGKKGQPMIVELNNNLTFNSIIDYRDFQTTYGQGSEGIVPLTASDARDTETSSWGAYMKGQKAINFLGEEYDYKYVDNWKKFYRTGVSNTTSVSLSGSSDDIDYRFGISNLQEVSILPNAGNTQRGINMNTTYHILKNLSLNVTANYVFENAKGRSNLSDGNGNTNAALLYHANGFDMDWMKGAGKWGTTAGGDEMIGGNNVYMNNPYWLQYRKTNDARKNRLTGAMTLKYDITDWLYVQGAVQRDGFNLQFKQVQPIGAAADPSGWMAEYSKHYSEMNWNYLVGFNKEFNKISVGATLGGNTQKNVTENYLTSDGGRPFIVDGLWSVNNLADKRAKKDYSEYQVRSIYGTLDLGYANQLFLNFTARNDWFSTLAPESNSYFYPSVTASWIFTDTFRESLPDAFDFGKIRAGWASASNGTSPYQNMMRYEVKNYTVNGQNVIIPSNGTYPNPALKPVRISEKEAGLNLSFFGSRLAIDFAVYEKNTKDDIAQVTTSGTSGFGSGILNVGEIRNRGLEFMVDITPVKTKEFMWNTTFNGAYNNSKVLYLGEGVERLSIDGASSRSGGVSVQNIVGEPYGCLVGYGYKRDDNGNKIIGDDGYAVKTDEKIILGNGVYKFTGGWRNAFRYNDFTLSFLIDAKFGAKLFSGTNLSLYGSGLHKETLAGRTEADPLGKYTADGVNTNGQQNTVQVRTKDYFNKLSSNEIAEEWIYDASFIKLRELSLGYNFKPMLKNVDWIQGLDVSLVARNLWTIMKHTPNIDPESAYNNSNGQGLELNGYPATRNIGLNVNLKFGAKKKAKEAVHTVPQTQIVEKIVEKVVEKPVVKEVVKEVANNVQSTYVVTFPVNSSEIINTAELAGIEKGQTVEIVAYASPEGNADANQALSQKRADAVAKYLQDKGVTVVRTSAKGADTEHANRIAIVTIK